MRRNHAFQSLFMLIGLTLLFRSYNQVELVKKCPKVPGIGPSINIVSEYFQTIFNVMRTDNEDTNIKLIQFSEQLHEAIVYRYIFKYVGDRQKTYYIGVLSTIPGDEVEKPNPKHIVVRFIQSTDINDAKRLLGMYDTLEESEEECGFKMSFWEYINQHPFNLEVEGNVKTEVSLPQKQEQKQETVPLDNFLMNMSQQNTVVSEQPAPPNNNNDDQILALLESLNSTTTVEEPALNMNFPTLHNQSGPTHTTTQFHVQTTNSNSGNEDLLNLLKNLENTNTTIKHTTHTTTHHPQTYSTKKRYQLGGIISGTGKDKIMNPKVVGSSHNTHNQGIDNDIEDILKHLGSFSNSF